jgi:hypothetical protein
MPSGLHVVSGHTAGSNPSYHLPKALIKRAEREDELSVKEWALYPVDVAFRNRSESGIALDCITAKYDRDVVQGRTIRRP